MHDFNDCGVLTIYKMAMRPPSHQFGSMPGHGPGNYLFFRSCGTLCTNNCMRGQPGWTTTGTSDMYDSQGYGTTHSGYGTTPVWCRGRSRNVEGCWGLTPAGGTMCFIDTPRGPYVLYWHFQGALFGLLTLPGGPMCWGFPYLKIEKFVGFTKFPFPAFWSIWNSYPWFWRFISRCPSSQNVMTWGTRD